MDKYVRVNIKENYRRQLENLLQVTETEGFVTSVRQIALNNVVYWSSEIKNKMQTKTLQKSWS